MESRSRKWKSSHPTAGGQPPFVANLCEARFRAFGLHTSQINFFYGVGGTTPGLKESFIQGASHSVKQQCADNVERPAADLAETSCCEAQMMHPCILPAR